MYSKSRPTPLRQRTSARKRPAGRESRGSQVAGRRGNDQQQMLEVLEDRRLLSGNPIIAGPAAIGEGGTYQLNLNANGNPVSEWAIDWGDGEVSFVPGSATGAAHVYADVDGLSFLNIMASADGCPADSAIPGQIGSLKFANTDTAVSGSGSDVVVQPDGKILVASAANFLSVSRYNADGSPDTGFGINGTASVLFGGGGPATVALQADGKILLGGKRVVGTNADFAVVRLNANGTQDTTFASATGGVASASFAAGANDEVRALAVQSDGKVVAAGDTFTPSAVGRHVALARFNSNGSLDSTFGTGGKVETTLFAELGDMELTPAGNIIVSARLGNSQMVAARFTSTGAADTTFDGDGRKEVAVVTGNTARFLSSTTGLALDSTGAVILSSSADEPGPFGNDFAVTRILSNGQVDTRFGDGGVAVVNFGNGVLDEVWDVAVDSADRIILAGETEAFDGGQFALARLTSRGGLDASFDFDGRVTTDFWTGFESAAGKVAVAADGSIVAAGFDLTLSGARLAVAQYATSEDVLSVRIDNAPPTLDPITRLMIGGTPEAPELVPYVGDGSITPYESLFFQFGVTDASAADRESIDISLDWGDASGVETGTVPGPLTFAGGHAYTHPGTYTIKLTATDKDGGYTEVTRTVVVSQAAVQVDPVNGGNMLVVGGSAAGNRIQVKAVTGGVQAIVDGDASPVFADVQRVVVYGNDGDDDVQVQASVVAEVYGGDGNDRLKANGTSDILVGDAGDDMVVGNGGRDLLVGGDGADKVVGNAEDDILVGGVYTEVTDSSFRRFAVSYVMREWTSGNDYPTRVNHIRYGTGATEGVARLAGYDATEVNGFQTVLDDGAEDKLTGDAGHDWFFANVDGPVTDKITDVLSPEFTDSDREFIFT